jgi:DNA-binding XRE family transcriptional regulator
MAEPGVGGTLPRRFVGRRLRELREAARLTQVQAAKHIEMSRFTMTRMEDGKPGVKLRAADLERLLELYQAPAEDRELLLAMAAEIRSGNKNWLFNRGATLPLLVQLEGDAARIREYEPELVPGLLQTRDYAEHIHRQPPGITDEATIRRRTDFRMARQQLLDRRAPLLDFVLNEAVLRRVVGGASVMDAQLERLVSDSRRPNVSIRVLPFSAGAHGSMVAPYSMFEFPPHPRTGKPLEPPMIYIDSLMGAMHYQQPDSVAMHRAVWDSLTAQSLDRDESREFITALRKEVYTDA